MLLLWPRRAGQAHIIPNGLPWATWITLCRIYRQYWQINAPTASWLYTNVCIYTSMLVSDLEYTSVSLDAHHNTEAWTLIWYLQ